MKSLVQEDTSVSTKSSSPIGSFLDAKRRSNEAFEKHVAVFDTDEHVARIEKVSCIVEEFFGHPPNYYTYRGIGSRKPFENVKVENVGYILSRIPVEVKNKNLYKPLLDLGNTEVISKNGHLIIRVFQQ